MDSPRPPPEIQLELVGVKICICDFPVLPREACNIIIAKQSATVRDQYLSGFLLHCWMVFMVNIDGVIRLMVCEVESVSEAVSFEDAAIYFLQQY